METLPWEKVGREHKRDLKKASLLLDLRRCVGCHACSVACKTEHDVALGSFRLRVRYIERPDRPTISFVPLMCMQCEDAPCIPVCPHEAVTRLEDGRVVINEQECEGEVCCVPACPYGAIYMDPVTNKADKCDLCTHRTEVGLDPACVDACPVEAIRYGDAADSKDPISQVAKKHDAGRVREAADTKPLVPYVGYEKWMDEKLNTGVQLSPNDEDVTYEQKKW